MIRAALALCLALFATAVAAQAPRPGEPPRPLSDAAKAMVGAFEFANADRDRLCTITFRAEPAGAAGRRVEFDRNCAGVFAFVREIAGWTMADNDFLRLVDAQGRSVLEFSEVESGVYEAPRPGEGILFIQAAAPPPEVKAPARFTGDWSVMRGSATLCVLSLSEAAAGSDFTVKVGAPCSSAVTRFAPVAWQVDRGELQIKNARGVVWRFEEADETSWRRVAPAADPVTLVRR